MDVIFVFVCEIIKYEEEEQQQRELRIKVYEEVYFCIFVCEIIKDFTFHK